MNLTHNQIIDFISEHLCIAKGEKIGMAWAYYAFGNEISHLRHDCIRYLEDLILKGDNSLLLSLYTLYLEQDYESLSLEQEIDQHANH